MRLLMSTNFVIRPPNLATTKNLNNRTTKISVTSSRSTSLRRQSFRIAREHGSETNVVNAEEKHGDALEPDAAAGVRRTAVAKRVDVGGDLRHVDRVVARALAQQVGIVDALRAGQNFLACEALRVAP